MAHRIIRSIITGSTIYGRRQSNFVRYNLKNYATPRPQTLHESDKYGSLHGCHVLKHEMCPKHEEKSCQLTKKYCHIYPCIHSQCKHA